MRASRITFIGSIYSPTEAAEIAFEGILDNFCKCTNFHGLIEKYRVEKIPRSEIIGKLKDDISMLTGVYYGPSTRLDYAVAEVTLEDGRTRIAIGNIFEDTIFLTPPRVDGMMDNTIRAADRLLGRKTKIDRFDMKKSQDGVTYVTIN